MNKNKRILIVVGIIIFTFILRFYRLEKIPGEWYGDISNVHEYEMQVLAGERPFYFFQSPGPPYHYLIAPVVLLYQNHGYETYKIASIVISLIGLIGVFLFVREISSVSLAFITTLITSFSFWYLVWSRLGNSQIVIPALVSFMSWFIARYVKKNKFTDLLSAGIFASLGWYTYPQTFIFPFVFVLFIVLFLIFRKKLVSQIRSLVLMLVIMVIIVIPFISIIKHDKGNFGPKGYVGGKILPNFNKAPQELVKKAAENYSKVLLMLHVKGDRTFRVNVSGHPQIDRISGIFFLLGFLYFASKKRRVWLFYILWMLLTLPLPSISPAIPEAEIPNSARTIGVVPFVFLSVAAGFWQSYRFLVNKFYNYYKSYKYSIGSLFSVLFAFIVFANLKLYFVDYTVGLPDRNLAPGRLIAEYIDQFPTNVAVYFSSCCWGEWGEPEPKGVVYQLHNGGRLNYINKLIENCSEIKSYPAVVVNDPRKEELLDKFRKCSSVSEVKDVVSTNGVLVSKLVLLN